MPAKARNYKYCVVPGCSSTSVSTADKLFFQVPPGKIRKKWCQIMRRTDLSQTSKRYCCEDHFNVEEDVADWIRFKILKESGQSVFQLRLKKDVVPHIFNCQLDRKRAHSKPVRSVIQKKQSKALVKELLRESQEIPDSSQNFLHDQLGAEEANADTSWIKHEISLFEQAASESSLSDQTTAEISLSDQATSLKEESLSSIEFVFTSGVLDSLEKTYKHFGCQVNLQNRPHFRSKGVQTKQPVPLVSTQTSPQKKFKRSPLKGIKPSHHENHEDSASEADSLRGVASAESSFCMNMNDDTDDNDYLRKQKPTSNIDKMKNKPKLYFGIDKENLDIISHLQAFTGCSEDHIMIVLRKVRLGESLDLLEDVFGISKTSISRVINNILPKISAFLESFISWPEKTIIQGNLPIAFHANYSHVESILDCFEVEIEKPSDPTHQALTWSNYKKCNTMKYLVSCTPDGYINFISPGYGGRATDCEIVQRSGYLDILEPNIVIMADGGFKEIESFLHKKKCSLVMPPSVSTDSKMTQAEVIETNVVASLRIHVERVIRRIREYTFLSAQSGFHHDLLHLLDQTVIIACALSNLQSGLVT